MPPAAVLAELDVAPAVTLPPNGSALAWLHRHASDADIFFVSNQSESTINAVVGFRAAGRKPGLWDAEQGTIRPAPGWTVAGAQVQVPLDLGPGKSIFVVFSQPGSPEPDPYVLAEGPARENPEFRPARFATGEDETTRVRVWTNGPHTLHHASGKTGQIEVTGLPHPLELPGPWSLRFQPNRGAPAEARLDKLSSWSQHPDPGIRYFSGTATNSIRFDLPDDFLADNRKVWLDLGEVAVIAEVRLNQQNLGILWHRPFRIEVSQALHPGTNTLEVDVTNLWVNRLIGDEQYPDDCEWTDKHLTRWSDWLTSGKPRPAADRVTFTTWKHWNAADPLLPSGLLGPVTLRPARLVPVP